MSFNITGRARTRWLKWISFDSTVSAVVINSPLIYIVNPSLRVADVEKAIGVTPIETISIHPLKPLYEACRRMVNSRARRIPIIDEDDETGRAMVVSVITQYRILKFVAVNVPETQMLRKPLKDLNMGTYKDLVTARMTTPVIEVIHMFVQKNISSVPILDADGELSLSDLQNIY